MLHCNAERSEIMAPIDYPSLERYARELRAQEMKRLEAVAVERMGVYVRLLGETALHALDLLSELLRPLFSWTPERRRHT
jgi:hypothetical protein